MHKTIPDLYVHAGRLFEFMDLWKIYVFDIRVQEYLNHVYK